VLNTLLYPIYAFVSMSERISSTRANYFAEFVVDGLFGIAMVFEGLALSGYAWATGFAIFLAGLFTFSFIEYFFHRWLFHVAPAIMVRGHAAHHHNPRGYDSLPFFLPLVIFLGLFWLFGSFMPLADAMILTGSIAIGYIIYGGSHYIIHHYRFTSPFALRWAAFHHIHHTHPDKNFGVTTPLWDLILRTYYYPRRRQ